MRISSPEYVDLVCERLSELAVAGVIPTGSGDYANDGRMLVNVNSASFTEALKGSPRLTLPVSARAIYLSGRKLRLFGVDGLPNRTVKFLLTDTLVEEVREESRTLLACLRAARLCARLQPGLAPTAHAPFDRRGRWIIEEVVSGQPMAPDKLAEFLQRDVLPFYERSARMRSWRRNPRVKEDLRVLKSFGIKFPMPGPDDVQPFVFGHGDLAPHNVLVRRDGSFCLIDWDTAGVLPAATDLVQMYKLVPTHLQWLLQVLRQLDPEGRAMPPQTQMALAIIQRTRLLRENGNLWVRRRMAIRGETRHEAKRRRTFEVDQLREYLRNLAEVR